MADKKSILVLSYNICFQAMCNDGSGSAIELGNSCTWIVKDQLTICAQNMADFIDGAPATVGHANFDFVGIQEANKMGYLQAATKKTLSKLQMIKSHSHATNKGHAMQMASFYDASKYTLIEQVCTQFNSWKTERPFHLLLLDDNATGEKIIFINVHSPHGSSQNTKYQPQHYSSFDAVSYDLSAAAKTMKHFDATTNYRIIMTGDFNETGWDRSGNTLRKKVWQPLGHAGVSTDAKIANVVFSCSKPDGYWFSANGHRGGDYIFSSGNPAKIVVPSNYVFAPAKGDSDDKDYLDKMKSIWQSDHLPVMAELS